MHGARMDLDTDSQGNFQLIQGGGESDRNVSEPEMQHQTSPHLGFSQNLLLEIEPGQCSMREHVTKGGAAKLGVCIPSLDTST